MDATAPSRIGSRLGRWFLLLALVPGVLLGFAACTSMSKERIEERIRALPSNQLPADARLERRRLVLDPGDGPRPFDVTWLHVPARPEHRDRPPLVLVHGTPGTLFTWTPILFGEDGLAGSRPVYAVEVLGHGFARGQARPYDFRRLGAWVGAWMHALGLRGVDLVGHSYGGEVCLNLALDEPDLVGRLVLMDSSGIRRRPEEFLPEEVKMREMGLARFGYLLNSADRVEVALEPHFRDQVRQDFLQEITLSCEGAENWRCMVALVRDEEGHRQADLPRLEQPTLLLWGSEDIAYPPARFGRAFEEALPSARLVVLEGTGHYPFEERPEATVRALREFLDGSNASGAGSPREQD